MTTSIPQETFTETYRGVLRGFARLLEPRPPQNVWQWAEANRWMSKGISSLSKRAPVRYSSRVAPHQRAMQEAFTDPDVQVTVLVMASQIGGKTETINNCIGYHMDHEPTNVVVMYPTVESTERYSKRKFSPMARDTPCLAKLLSPARSRDSGNTILVKEFLGGSVFFVGANSAASLRQSSGEILIADEIDSMSDNEEGDPVELLWKRAESYEDAVKIVSSTPTVTGSSRIWDWFEQSDQNYWLVPCPRCGHHQQLRWAQVRWPSKPKHDARRAVYVCEQCEGEWNDKQRLDAYYHGRWQPTAEFGGVRGFHLNGLYCPWPAHKGFDGRLHESVADFLRVKDDPGKLRVWTNTFLAETFEEEAEKPPDASWVQSRCESYGADPLPDGVLVVTAAVDVQADRLEALVVGWGEGEELWGLEMHRFLGNPELPKVWEQLADLLGRRWQHVGGPQPIACCTIDSGHKPKHVYQFCRRMAPLRVFPTKGSSTPGAPLRSMPRKTTVRGVPLVLVGSTTAKDHIYSRLKIDTPGPRYLHFPIDHGFDPEFFAQITAEKRRIRYIRGRMTPEYVKTRARNEAIDLLCLNLAALDILEPNWEVLSSRLAKAKESADKEAKGDSARMTTAPARRPFATRWRT